MTSLPSSPVPLFPLPGVLLYPAQVLPLQIFEPRYLQMTEDLLDGPGRLVIATTTGSGEPAPVLEVAGLGEIVRHEKLPDGRYHLWVLGLTRVRMEEVPSDRPYRLVRCVEFAEVQAPPDEARRLRTLLREAAESRMPPKVPLPKATPTGILTDLLLQMVDAPQAEVASIFTRESVAERARLALAAHQRYPRSRHDETEA